jgi:hypothetical protein
MDPSQFLPRASCLASFFANLPPGVERHVRRLWPGSLVGGLRDPLVGRDLLVGCVVSTSTAIALLGLLRLRNHPLGTQAPHIWHWRSWRRCCCTGFTRRRPAVVRRCIAGRLADPAWHVETISFRRASRSLGRWTFLVQPWSFVLGSANVLSRAEARRHRHVSRAQLRDSRLCARNLSRQSVGRSEP